ncbi:hypothetical protein PUNSTDRAFT_67152 [Punctularia strigosozonata HHB-11173 SS5]|uniref:uncharacterized protein n=1 Tax=Punctularia strigosozonata (strain HHB-11173) TaxID=741275 RepID=UPI0004417DE0|nr:uncharacterized protein PUNSTDRAFT_67152 [Punctularia strigosozonata HHB-11173 SS5]EIN09392.1 hypothetical protein PUNSTDRAFT_67152 [Punctularia strigosozonata HHB-11173 SS5]
MSENRLVDAWQDCVSEAVPAKIAAEDELTKAYQTHTEQVKRTHDYEPFIHGFITCLHRDHLLNPLIGRDEDGKRLPATKTRR